MATQVTIGGQTYTVDGHRPISGGVFHSQYDSLWTAVANALNSDVVTVSGTANQVVAVTSSGAVTVSLSSTLVAPGSVSVVGAFNAEAAAKIGGSGSTVGFYGATGVTKQTEATALSLTGTYASDYAAIQTAVNALITQLHNVGLTT